MRVQKRNLHTLHVERSTVVWANFLPMLSVRRDGDRMGSKAAHPTTNAVILNEVKNLGLEHVAEL